MTQRIARIDVWTNDQSGATRNRWIQAAHQLGYPQLTHCREARIFFLQGTFTDHDLNRLAHDLLADPVTESVMINPTYHLQDNQHIVDVALLPGVTDPVAENLVAAAGRMGIGGVEQAATGHTFHLDGISTDTALQLAQRLFHNATIQQFSLDQPISASFMSDSAPGDVVEMIAIRGLDADGLLALSNERRLSLNVDEMRSIQDYYASEDRDPTDVELEMIAQTWSEHCVHKTFKATIDYLGPLPGETTGQVPQTINGLLKTYIRRATEELNKDWVRSAFIDNAGIIAFDDKFDLAFKVETHNHPSAIEPFGGANTGVGGVIRDVLGVSARPIANTDVLCFGPQDIVPETLPDGVLHPSLIADGVVHGIEDYGNKMGIPTVNGAILYHDGYTANPLVYCGCLGILPHGSNPTNVQPHDLIVVIGGRTGRDGLRGATFSSMEMDGTTGQVAGSSVQIGHPIHEKQTQEVILQARDEKLYNAITDCGAGGLSSAVGEMGAAIGATVQLKDVPLKYPGLHPWEIWLSEAQERMVLAVSSENWPRLQAIAAGQDIEAVSIGTFEPTGRLTLYDGSRLVGDISMEFLHDGIPTMNLKAEWSSSSPRPHNNNRDAEFSVILLDLLRHPNIRSKEDVVRRYDHEIQSGSVVKPFAGENEIAPNNAAVLVPRDTRHVANAGAVKGVAIGNGICPQYTEADPYAMTWAAVDEAIRNVVAVGADPDQIAILDNFCWGNPKLPDRLGSLVRCVQGCYDAALAYGVPFISGKDSLNNEYTAADGSRHAIPGTLLISAIGIVPDVQQTVTSDLKQAGNTLYQLGETLAEAENTQAHLNRLPFEVPEPKTNPLPLLRALHQAIQAGYVKACHDLSEGGLGVTLAEMCIGGHLGANITLAPIGQPTAIALFGESLGRFVVEIAPRDRAAFEAIVADIPFVQLGEVTATPTLKIDALLSIPVDLLAEASGASLKTNATIPVPALPQLHVDKPTPTPKLRRPRVLLLHANGTNRDLDAAMAIELAGGTPEVVHINQLLNGDKHLGDYQMLIVPGGFSYGDDMGAGLLWAKDLEYRLQDMIAPFVADGRPVLGICNGFQVLVKAGLLPGPDFMRNGRRTVTLTYNDSGHFECRWVYLQPNPNSPSIFTDGLTEPIYCPVAHGEGRIAFADDESRDAVWNAGLATLLYANADGELAGYPFNPNGSVYNIAALTNPEGNVMGLMPHPENHIFPYQHPRYHRGETGNLGLSLFQNGIKFA